MREAQCRCGQLKVRCEGEPGRISACHCLNCQRRSGSAFSYGAFFDEPAVTIGGEPKSWRSTSAAGRWTEANFCPTCGVTLFTRLEVLPGVVCVAAGAFSDADFPSPGKLYWSSRRHRWLDLPDGIEKIDTQ